MRMFLLGAVAAIIVAIATGYALDQIEVASKVFNSTENVRL